MANFAFAAAQHHIAGARRIQSPPPVGRALDHHHDRLRQRLESASSILHNSRLPSATKSFSPGFGAADLNIAMKPLMSPPAQDVGHAPRITIALILAIIFHQIRKGGQVAYHVAVDRVLRVSGRLSVTCSVTRGAPGAEFRNTECRSNYI